MEPVYLYYDDEKEWYQFPLYARGRFDSVVLRKYVRDSQSFYVPATERHHIPEELLVNVRRVYDGDRSSIRNLKTIAEYELERMENGKPKQKGAYMDVVYKVGNGLFALGLFILLALAIKFMYQRTQAPDLSCQQGIEVLRTPYGYVIPTGNPCIVGDMPRVSLPKLGI